MPQPPGIFQDLEIYRAWKYPGCVNHLGSGKKFDIPPSDFVPLSLSIENKCVKCNDVFENTNSVKSHIKDEHKEDVKKAYSKEAMEMVMEDKIYMDWLNETTSVDSENDRTTISKLQKANRILTEKLNMQSEKEYTMVKENNGVTEMQKKYTQQQIRA